MRHAAAIALFLGLVLPPAAPAADRDPRAVLRRMHAAVWPDRPSVRTLTLTVTTDEGGTTEATAGQVRRRVDGKPRLATVVLSPPDARGAAWLVEDPPGGETLLWVYTPVVRRVRQIQPAHRYQAFLHSDFTFADVGLIDWDATATLRGETTRNGLAAWEVEQVPEARWYYGRIVTWIAKESGFPLERHFYDPANTLWKVERFENPVVIADVPTVLRFVMEDRHTGGRSEIRVSEVRYDVEVPDDLLRPDGLRTATESRLW